VNWTLTLDQGWANNGPWALYHQLGFLIRYTEFVHTRTYEGVKGKGPAYVLAQPRSLGRGWGGPDDVQGLLVPADIMS